MISYNKREYAKTHRNNKTFLKNKFMSFYATIHILDAHMPKEFFTDNFSCLEQPRKSHFPLALTDGLTK